MGDWLPTISFPSLPSISETVVVSLETIKEWNLLGCMGRRTVGVHLGNIYIPATYTKRNVWHTEDFFNCSMKTPLGKLKLEMEAIT